jgi:hypothetical protein
MHTDLYACVFAQIPPHGEATVMVTAKDYGGGGTYNRAVVGTSSPDGNGANNVAAARTKKPVRRYRACGSSIATASRC